MATRKRKNAVPFPHDRKDQNQRDYCCKKGFFKAKKKNKEVANLSIKNVESVLLEDNLKQATNMNFLSVIVPAW